MANLTRYVCDNPECNFESKVDELRHVHFEINMDSGYDDKIDSFDLCKGCYQKFKNADMMAIAQLFVDIKKNGPKT